MRSFIGALRQARSNVIEQNVRRLVGGCSLVEVLHRAIRADPVAAEANFALLVLELICVYRKKAFGEEADGHRFRSLHELERGRVGTQKFLNCIRMRRVRGAFVYGSQEFHKLFRGASRETIHGMGNDVGVNVLGKIEANREASRARFRMVIGNAGNAGEIGESHLDRGGSALEVRRRVSVFAAGAGVNVPLSRIPFACAGR